MEQKTTDKHVPMFLTTQLTHLTRLVSLANDFICVRNLGHSRLDFWTKVSFPIAYIDSILAWAYAVYLTRPRSAGALWWAAEVDFETPYPVARDLLWKG